MSKQRHDIWLIPAHAGKTALVMLTVLLLTAHPRSRGENGAGAFTHASRGAHPRSRGENHRPLRGLVYAAGSSPLTRGKPWP